MSQADTMTSWPQNDQHFSSCWSFLRSAFLLQAQETQVPSRPRAKFCGGYDIMSHCHVMERTPSLKPDRASSNADSATNLLCDLGQIVSSSGTSAFSTNGGRHLHPPKALERLEKLCGKSQGRSAQTVGSQEMPAPGFLFQALSLGH